jgi:hypothetical protein
MSVSASARSARHLTPLLAMSDAIGAVGVSLTSTNTHSIRRANAAAFTP